MLTNFQCEPIAYGHPETGTILCVDCAAGPFGGEDAPRANFDELFIHYYGILDPAITGLYPISRYALEEGNEGGLDCEGCGTTLVEPDTDYCLAHGSERLYDGAPDYKQRDVCEEHSDDPDDRCVFPEVDPNPPAARWVPCSKCGAGDGQRHKGGCPDAS